MKMGQLIVGTHGGFIMQTPNGVQDVTLRCRNDGVVLVEEVADGKLSTRALEIQVQINEMNVEKAKRDLRIMGDRLRNVD